MENVNSYLFISKTDKKNPRDVVTYLLFTKTSVTRNVLSDRRLHVTVTLVFMQSTMLTSSAPCGHARCGDPCWRWWREYH